MSTLLTEKSLWKRIARMKSLYLLLIIPAIWVIVFCYMPMYGIIIAFKDFSFGKGIFGSPFNNFNHFRLLVSEPSFIRIVKNTVLLSILNMIFSFPAPIILALMLNEMRNAIYKKIVQSISYLPYFLSWVVLASFIIEALSPQRGVVNEIIKIFGGEAIDFLTEKEWFRPIIVISNIWQNVGWGSIVYLAVLSAIDTQLYDAANVDGATRFHRIFYINIPSLVPLITFFAIMNMSSILVSNFDQVFNLMNPLTNEVGEVVSTYVYKVGLVEQRYDFAAAVGLAQNLVGVTLLFITNKIVKRFSEYTVW